MTQHPVHATSSLSSPRSLGERLRWHRLRLGLSQEALAEAIGASARSVRRWEQALALPQEISRERLAHLFGIQVEQLGDLPLPAEAATRLLPLWLVPAPRNSCFTGREAILHRLHTALGTTQTARAPATALQGLAGVGKTQIALEYAYRYAQDYAAIFWLEAETRAHILSSMQRIAEVLALPERAEAEQQRSVEAVNRWLATHQRWLLIWDNLEDLDLLRRFLPSNRRGALLLTTRVQALGTLAQGINLPPLEGEEGMLLLLRRANVLEREDGREQVQQLAGCHPAEYAAARELVRLLGGLPLALDQAGAYVEETGCSLSDYLQRYAQREASLLARRGSAVHAHPQSVTTTFRLSQERVEQEQPAAGDLLRVCVFLAAEAIPEEVFQVGAIHLGPRLAALGEDLLGWDQVVAILRNLSLVQRQSQTHTLSLHRLVQAVLREQMPPEEVWAWSARVVRMIHAVFPAAAFASWTECERYLGQALACAPLITTVGREVPEAGELLTNAGNYLTQRGHFAEAEPLLAQAVRLGEQHHGSDHPALIPRLTSQADLYERQGKYGQAEELLSRTLAIEERHLEPTHVQIAETLNDLALSLSEQGKYAQAELLLQRSLRIWEGQVGPPQPKFADTLNNLAEIYCKQDKYEQAELLYERAWRIAEQALGPEHPNTALMLTSLAVVYNNQAKYEQAEPLFQRALHIAEQALGSEHPEVAHVLTGLAILYTDQGKYEQAELLYERVLRIQEQALGSDHPNVARSLHWLATLYTKQGKYEQAESLFQRALHIAEQALMSEYPDAVRPLYGLATLYTEQGKYEQAEPFYEQALGICERVLGPEHPNMALMLAGLAVVYYNQAKYEQAEPLFQRALDIQEQTLNPEHPDVARPLYGLAILYTEQDKYEQAEPLFQRALHVAEQALGPEHPEVARSLHGLATLYMKQGQYAQAELLFQRALHIRELRLGVGHGETARTLAALTNLFQKQGEEEETNGNG